MLGGLKNNTAAGRRLWILCDTLALFDLVLSRGPLGAGVMEGPREASDLCAAAKMGTVRKGCRQWDTL